MQLIVTNAARAVSYLIYSRFTLLTPRASPQHKVNSQISATYSLMEIPNFAL